MTVHSLRGLHSALVHACIAMVSGKRLWMVCSHEHVHAMPVHSLRGLHSSALVHACIATVSGKRLWMVCFHEHAHALPVYSLRGLHSSALAHTLCAGRACCTRGAQRSGVLRSHARSQSRAYVLIRQSD
jgi:hypothetical protein